MGSVVYECLDYGMEVFVECEFDEEFEKFIVDMINCDYISEGVLMLDNLSFDLLSFCGRLILKNESDCFEKV